MTDVKAPAVDTGKAAKAIWEVLWPGTSDVMDAAELGSERAQVRRILFALAGAGILQDAAEVEASAFREAAAVAQRRAEDLRSCHKDDDCNSKAGTAQTVADDILYLMSMGELGMYQRAQQVRKGEKND